jgi:hypothetical protein
VTSLIQNSKFVIQNFPAGGSAALGKSAANVFFPAQKTKKVSREHMHTTDLGIPPAKAS